MAHNSNAGTLIALSESSASGITPGTYSIQMTECQSCVKNTNTVNTMLAVMQQQATTLKEQQSTIANLITMLSNATGGTTTTVGSLLKSPGAVTAAKTVTMPPKLNTIIAAKKPLAKSPAASSAKSTPTTASKINVKRPATTPSVAASTSKRRNESEELFAAASAAENGDSSIKREKTDEDIAVTKIWIKGTPHMSKEKCPCPLPECANRKFAAADMYYLRRHFQQVHRLTHPNPMFVIQCPVDDCEAEFDGSLRDMRKHLVKEHAEYYADLRVHSTPTAKHVVENDETEEAEDAVEEQMSEE